MDTHLHAEPVLQKLLKKLYVRSTETARDRADSEPLALDPAASTADTGGLKVDSKQTTKNVKKEADPMRSEQNPQRRFAAGYFF